MILQDEVENHDRKDGKDQTGHRLPILNRVLAIEEVGRERERL